VRTLSATQLAQQLERDRTPYIKFILDNGVTQYDYSTDVATDRLLSIEHTEAPYTEEADVILNNFDRAVPDLRGYHVDPEYGDVVPGVGNESAEYPRLWVVSQYERSQPGGTLGLTVTLKLWGAWTLLSMIYVDHVGAAPFYDYIYNRTTTPLDIMTPALADVSITLTDNSSDDLITDTMTPYIEVNMPSQESYQGLLKRLINITKKYYRMDVNQTCYLIYPQDSDAVDETYYTVTTAGYMTALFHAEQMNESIPNKVVVYCNQDADAAWNEGWGSMITGTAEDTTASARFQPLGQTNVIEYSVAPTINNQTDADKYASARLIRSKAESRAAWFECPHDARLQCYDRVQVIDVRGF